MADLTTSLSETDFVDEVRTALAGLDATKIPDDTIVQARDRFVEPLLNDIKEYTASKDQDNFDNTVIALTAERAFAAWLKFTRLRDREVESYIDPDSYMEDLKERSDQSMGILGVTRPPTVPNTIETIKHDGEKIRVDLSRQWKDTR